MFASFHSLEKYIPQSIYSYMLTIKMPLSLLSCFTDIFLCQSHDSCKWDSSLIFFTDQTKIKIYVHNWWPIFFLLQTRCSHMSEDTFPWCLSTWWGFAALLSSAVLYWLPWHPHHNIIIVIAIRFRSSEFNWEIEFVHAQKPVTMSLSVLARKENKEEKMCKLKRNTKWSVYLNVF